MKRLMLLILCILAGWKATGQQPYRVMLADSNRWTVTTWFESCRTHTLFTDGEVSIGNSVYKKLYLYHFTLQNTTLRSFLREDTITRKVFFRRSIAGGPDTVEHVLYDFSLQPGDSIYLFNPYLMQDFHPLGDSLGWYYVDSITNFNTLTGNRKLFHLRGDSNYVANSLLNNPKWLEGVGEIDPFSHGSNGTLYHYTNIPTSTQCAFQNGQQLVHNPVYGGWSSDSTLCDCNANSISSIHEAGITLSPNPAENQIRIQGFDPGTEVPYRINNMEGKLFQYGLADTDGNVDINAL
ncbi:MAG: hypothetical protein EOP49_11915, partial [Sphingobacteriales bacterium]